jgi:hypothetical protein
VVPAKLVLVKTASGIHDRMKKEAEPKFGLLLYVGSDASRHLALAEELG